MEDMTESDENWQKLSRLIKSRMNEVGATPQTIQECGGPKPTKLRELLNNRARTLRDSLKPGLERAIRWAPGDIDRVLAGGDPTPQSVDINWTPPTDTELRLWIIELAIQSDAIGSEINADDPDGMQLVKAVLRDSAELVEKLGNVALAVAGGDAYRLQRLKREVKMGRLTEVFENLSIDEPGDGRAPDFDPAAGTGDALRAASNTLPGYPKGQPGPDPGVRSPAVQSVPADRDHDGPDRAAGESPPDVPRNLSADEP